MLSYDTLYHTLHPLLTPLYSYLLYSYLLYSKEPHQVGVPQRHRQRPLNRPDRVSFQPPHPPPRRPRRPPLQLLTWRWHCLQRWTLLVLLGTPSLWTNHKGQAADSNLHQRIRWTILCSPICKVLLTYSSSRFTDTSFNCHTNPSLVLPSTLLGCTTNLTLSYPSLLLSYPRQAWVSYERIFLPPLQLQDPTNWTL